jgi:hypothetical protein
MDEKMKYICETSRDLSYETHIRIKNMVDKRFAKECTDGMRINLSNLPDNLINKIYYYIKNQV